jgi:hypothetical protein
MSDNTPVGANTPTLSSRDGKSPRNGACTVRGGSLYARSRRQPSPPATRIFVSRQHRRPFKRLSGILRFLDTFGHERPKLTVKIGGRAR